MSETPSPPADAGTVEILRRVKATETEWEEKLRSARAEKDAALAEARARADATVKSVGAELEAAHTQTVESAATAAAAEASAILAVGETAAARARTGAEKTTNARRDEILRAVLGEFAEP